MDVKVDIKGIAEFMLFQLHHAVVFPQISLLETHIPSIELVWRNAHLHRLNFPMLHRKRVEIIIGIGQSNILYEREVICGTPNTL